MSAKRQPRRDREAATTMRAFAALCARRAFRVPAVTAAVAFVIIFASGCSQQAQQTNAVAPAALDPDGVVFAGGFSPLESNATNHWHWAVSSNASIHVRNETKQPRQATLAWYATALAPTTLTATTGSARATAHISHTWTAMSLHVLLRPGDNDVVFRTAGPGTNNPGDPRTLYFSVIDFAVRWVP